MGRMIDRILVVAPHPDDEVLGCGGTIRKFTSKGREAHVLIVTRGDPKLYAEERIANVRNEARKAHRLLGVAETVFADYLAPNLDMTSKAEIAGTIGETIRERKIDTLFLPHRGDIHHDHRVVFEAGLVAARPVGANPVKKIFAYETLSETEWAAPYSDDSFIPTYFVDIAQEIEHKLAAISCFASQLREFPNPRSLENIESLAKFRGATVGFERAEAFATIRIIEN